MFLNFFREGEREHTYKWERAAEGEKERVSSRVLTEPDSGLDLVIQMVRSQTLHQLNRPDAPRFAFLKRWFLWLHERQSGRDQLAYWFSAMNFWNTVETPWKNLRLSPTWLCTWASLVWDLSISFNISFNILKFLSLSQGRESLS